MDIKETAEQLANRIKRTMAINPGITDDHEIIAETCRAAYPGIDIQAVMEATWKNTMLKMISRLRREEVMVCSGWKQMDLFDSNKIIYPPDIFAGGKKKKFEKATLAESRENAVQVLELIKKTMADLKTAYSQKENQMLKWEGHLEQIEQLIKTAIALGLDPGSLTYEQAAKKTQAAKPQKDIDRAAIRQVRPVPFTIGSGVRVGSYNPA